MKKSIILAALCGAFLAAPAMADADDDAPGFTFGPRQNITFLPTVNAGVFWESNARRTASNEKDGAAWRVQPMFSLTYNTLQTNLSASGFYTLIRGFEDKNAQDSDTYGAALSLRRALGKRWNFISSLTYSRTENDEFYGEGWSGPGSPAYVDENRSENYNFMLSLGYRGEKWKSSVSGGWSRSRQLDGWRIVSNTYTGSLLVGRMLGAHMSWDNSVTMSIHDPQRGKISESYYLMTGVAGEVTQKTSYTAMGGVAIQSFHGYQNETAVGPAYNVSVAHRFTQTLAASALLSSTYKAENNGDVKATYVWRHSLTGAVNKAWTDRINSRLNASVIYEDHQAGGSAYKSQEWERTYIRVAFNTSYKFNKYMSLYGGVSWSDNLYSGGGKKDYDCFRADLGLTFVF